MVSSSQLLKIKEKPLSKLGSIKLDKYSSPTKFLLNTLCSSNLHMSSSSPVPSINLTLLSQSICSDWSVKLLFIKMV